MNTAYESAELDLSPRRGTTAALFRGLITASASVLLAVSLAGCGGSGGGGSSDNGMDGSGSDGSGGSGMDGSGSDGMGSTAGGVTTLEYFLGSLDAVQPSSPSAVITADADVPVLLRENGGVEPELLPGKYPQSPMLVPALSTNSSDNVLPPIPFLAADFNAEGITNLHPAVVLYSRTDGSIWRADTETGQTPMPKRVSSGSVSDYCGAKAGPDFGDIDNSRLAYSDSEDGGICVGYRVISLGDDGSTAPLDFTGRPVTPLNDPDTGALIGWLSVADGDLVRLSTDGTAAGESLASLTQGAPVSLGSVRGGVYFLNLNGRLYAYNSPADTLTDLNHDFETVIQNGDSRDASFHATDADNLYFVDNAVLYRTDVAAGTTRILDQPSDASPAAAAGTLHVGLDRVVWAVLHIDLSNAGASLPEAQLRSVDKDDGSGLKVLDTLTIGDTLSRIGNTGRYLFYTRTTGIGDSVDAVAMRMDGSDTQTFPNARWIGASLPSTRQFSTTVSRVFRVDGLNTPSDALGGKTLFSVDASDPTAAINLGNIPTDAQRLIILPGFGPGRLASMFISDGTAAGGNFDVLYLDQTEAGSLQRITDTDDKDESPVGAF